MKDILAHERLDRLLERVADQGRGFLLFKTDHAAWKDMATRWLETMERRVEVLELQGFGCRSGREWKGREADLRIELTRFADKTWEFRCGAYSKTFGPGHTPAEALRRMAEELEG